MAQYLKENKEIGSLVRELESNFTNNGGTVMSKYVTTDLYSDINRIYAYLESKHISGETDSMGREKPFFNIVTAARNIYYRATDIDRKNIEVTPSKSKQVATAFIATVLLQKWMKEENFGAFLNDMGMELAGFNSAVVKFVETAGKLHKMVVPWSRLIVDQINFDANPKIEVLELTEAELRQRKGYDQKMVERLCAAVATRELTDGTQQDQKTGYIKLFEIHGVFPLSYLTGKEKDEYTYEQQMHVISFVESKKKGEYDDFTLIAGREQKDPYMLVSLLPATDGSISLNGSVKNLFEAQWMMNHSVKSIKDQLDVASKLIFQTADVNFVGRNVLNAVEQGDILVHGVNTELTQLNNGSHDITSQQSFGNMWKGLSNEINGISEAMTGQNPPTGTAWRQVATLLQESHSLFELMTENKGLAIEQMLRIYVIPFLKKQMNNSDEISAILEAHNISKLDAMYVPKEAIKRFNADVKAKLLKGEVPEPFNPDTAQAQVKDQLAQNGNQRFFVPSDISDATWAEALKDLEWELDINITGESQDKQGILDTLSTALQAIANPAYASNPQAQLVVSKILSLTGAITPLEIASAPAPEPPAPTPVASPPQALPTNTQ